ncbi:MAG: hypothetical protein ACREPM_20740 [Gemmatimonadaceae bacterium]
MQRTTNLRLPSLTAVLAAAVALSGCYHSTRLAATWKEPGAGPIHFRQPIVVFVSKDAVFRRTMEDKLASHFDNAVPSYRVLGNTDMTSGEKVLHQLDESGYDGAIVMDVVNVANVVTYTPGTYWYGPPYYSFAGYWGTAWGYPYDPGYAASNVVVSIETQIYSLRDDKLIWAARSETTDPRSVGKLGDSVIRHVMQALRKEGLVAVLCGDLCGVVGHAH